MALALWTPLAENDLEEILFQIRVVGERPETARRIAEAIRNEANARANMDVPGQIHPAAPDGWLYFRLKRWLIFYQPRSEGIEVLRVLDGARDLPGRFFVNE